MICSSYLRNVGNFFRRSFWLGRVTRVLYDNLGFTYIWNCKFRKFRVSAKMMVDIGVSDNRRSIVVVLLEKEDDGGYVSGGCKR